MQKRKKIIILLVLILACCVVFALLALFGLSLPPELSLRNPDSLISQSDNPTQKISLNCVNPRVVKFNDIELSRVEIDQELCSDNGYEVKLENGENNFTITADNTKGETDTIEMTINFDINAYNNRLAQEEAQKLEQEKKEAEEQQRLKEEEEKKKAEEQAEKNKPKLGDSLQGPNYEEINNEYERQNNLSSYKGDQYLKGLIDTEVIWIGEIGDVEEELFGDDYYISIRLSDKTFDFDTAFINRPSQEDLNIDSGTLVKVTAKIEDIDTGTFGVTAYLYEAKIEKL